ncbi:MAG: signal peptidase I [Bacteroidota bacterium]
MAEEPRHEPGLPEAVHLGAHPGAHPARGTPSKKRGGWLRLIVLALLVAVVLRVFVLEPYRIPTPSMAGTLLPGDHVLVSKLHYGPRLPITLGVPFAEWTWDGVELPGWRWPGFSDVRRGDVIVFNQPRQPGPIDQRMPFVKRAVGLPGDTIAIVDKQVQVNGVPIVERGVIQYDWIVELEDDRARTLDAPSLTSPPEGLGRGRFRIAATTEQADVLRGREAVAGVEMIRQPQGARGGVFPFGSGNTLDSYGPLFVPQAGNSVPLTDDTWPMLQAILTEYEGHNVRRRPDGAFEVDGVTRSTYTFEQDYYFALGDNRDQSSDSRIWGFVPHDHVIGKAVLVHTSSGPDGVRWDRVGRWIK